MLEKKYDEIFDPDMKIEIENNFNFKPDKVTEIYLRKIITYKFSEFKEEFKDMKDMEDIKENALHYIQEYIDYGITYDKIKIIVKFLNKYHKILDRKNLKQNKLNIRIVRTILKHMESIVGTSYTLCSYDRKCHQRHYKDGKVIWVNKHTIHIKKRKTKWVN